MFTIDLPIIVLMVAVVLFGMAATAWGVDSRPEFSDDRVH
jgi:hypothetical protein